MNGSEPARIGLISNRNSGHNRDQFEQIKQLVAGCKNVNHLETASSGDIPAALRQLVEQKIEVLAINGGDGTVSAILGHALEHTSFGKLPPVVVLPGGTANMNAGDIGARGKLLPAVRRFCHWAGSGGNLGGEQVQRSLMRVQIGAETSVHYGMFLGMGAVIQGTEYAHQEIHSRGLRDDFSVALGVARTVWGLIRDDPRFSQTVAVNLRLNDATDSHDYNALIIVVSSLQRLFLGMRPFWGTGPGPLRLTLIMEHPHRFLRTFIAIARGKPNRHATTDNGYISHNADRINISMQGSLNLDGEILTSEPAAGPITITASPMVTFIRL
ncbi:MAG: diacylglycerol kinase family protein [Gammaproteobacteria bacterium]|nr:diacylglycerol kinase family protein [Gammaproteobacteria bacterium]